MGHVSVVLVTVNLDKEDCWTKAVEEAAREASDGKKRLVVRLVGAEKSIELEVLRKMYKAVGVVSPRLDAVPEFVDRASNGDHDEVAVGGTFDRLHAGHRLLLAASALSCRRRVYVGVAGDQLLRKKQFADTIEAFDVRSKGVVDFLRSVNKDVDVVVSALVDPKEPTKASTTSTITALVVSRETMKGAEKVARVRRELGVEPPLAFVVVGLVGGSEDDVDSKLSSSRLRAEEEEEGQVKFR